MWEGLDDLLDEYDDFSLGNDNTSELTKFMCQKYENKVDFNVKKSNQNRDKGDRATTDHALDKRTVFIIFKMIHQGDFDEINGCISTGKFLFCCKEANVYHAISSRGDLALKLHMTSKLAFKARNKYVQGDFRMRHGYSTCSSWKLVSKWAEKEYRNLIRIEKAGSIPSPRPLKLKGVLVLMTLIGKNGLPAPKLKDVANEKNWLEFGPVPDWPVLYRQVLENVRTLFQKCRLVHGDLSEYNLLYMDGRAWMIDVSQAVEHECDQALELLREDCYNVNHFFRRQGVSTLTLREFFEWVVDPTLPQEENESKPFLNAIMKRAEERGFNETLDVEDDAFRRVYVPRRLEDVRRYVRDLKRLKAGIIKPEDLYYTAVTGVKSGLPHPKNDKNQGEEAEQDEESDHSDENEEHEGSNENGEEEEDENNKDEEKRSSGFVSSRRPKNEDPESKKARKKAVQVAKAERRREKIPKHVKKRAAKNKS
nr:serine:threonine protein kinase RIO1 [Hymenolepis microstoma]